MAPSPSSGGTMFQFTYKLSSMGRQAKCNLHPR
jgi:hypothetical protein